MHIYSVIVFFSPEDKAQKDDHADNPKAAENSRMIANESK